MQQSVDSEALYGYHARKAAKARKEQEHTERIAQALLSRMPIQSQGAVQNIDPKIDDVKKELLELRAALHKAQQKLSVYEQEQPRYINAVNSVESRYAHQLPIVKEFLETQVRKNPTGKILNHDLNNALIDFADEGDVHIETYEVAKLMRYFGFDYSESNGKSYYRGLEFIPLQKNIATQIQSPMMSPQATPNKVRDDTMSSVGSPAPVMVNRT